MKRFRNSISFYTRNAFNYRINLLLIGSTDYDWVSIKMSSNFEILTNTSLSSASRTPSHSVYADRCLWVRLMKATTPCVETEAAESACLSFMFAWNTHETASVLHFAWSIVDAGCVAPNSSSANDHLCHWRGIWPRKYISFRRGDIWRHVRALLLLLLWLTSSRGLDPSWWAKQS